MSEPLLVKVWTPFETFFEGRATSISAINKTGPFDILEDHSNFFTILLPGDVVVRTGQEEKTYPIERGILRVSDNRVTIFSNL